jgi:hypothetical protein
MSLNYVLSDDDSIVDVLNIAKNLNSSSDTDSSSASTTSFSSGSSSTTSGGLMWIDDIAAESDFDADDEYELDPDDVERVPRSYKFWNRQIVKKARKMNSRQFHNCFRMSKETFEKLLMEIEDELPIGSSSNGKSLTARERLLCFLWFVGGNSTLGQGEYAHSMSFGSVANRQATFQ